MKILAGVYFASFAVGIGSIIWFALVAMGVFGEDAKVSPWPLVIAVFVMLVSKYAMAFSNKRSASNG